MASDKNGNGVTQHGTLASDDQFGWLSSSPDTSAWNLLSPVISAGGDPGLMAPVLAASAPPGDSLNSTPTSATGPVLNAGSVSPFVIDISYDSNASAYSGFSSLQSAVNAAVSYLESVITNNITLTIQIGWGEVNGKPLSGSVGASVSEANGSVTYNQVRSALTSHATSAADHTSVATLPLSDPAGASNYWVTDAQAKALGLNYNGVAPFDGYVGLNDTYGYTWDHTAAASKIDAVGVLEHEITEVMGRIGSLGSYIASGEYTPLDLFRYSSAGTRDLNPTSTSTDHFSYDGQTMLTQFNNPTGGGGDAADWSTPPVFGDAFGGASYNTVMNVSSTDLSVMDVIGYTLASAVACFAAGSRIAAEQGEVAVEQLQAGDRVYTRFSGLTPVKWIGQRWTDCARHPDPLSVMPVHIAPHALGPDLPRRELLLSPEHALELEGTLVPIRFLINGGSIWQESVPRQVHYFHVELERHDLLDVEGLPAESYLDTGNRAAFANAGLPTLLQPIFDNGQALREDESCLPLLLDPQRLEILWHRLAERARRLGYVLPTMETTQDAGLRLATPDGLLSPVASNGTRCRFVLPGSVAELRLVSRRAVPAALRPWLDDRRELGVMVRGITLHGPEGQTEVAVDDPRLRDGWWAAESDRGAVWRWTNGNALLPVPPDTRMVELRLGPALAYKLAPGFLQQQAA